MDLTNCWWKLCEELFVVVLDSNPSTQEAERGKRMARRWRPRLQEETLSQTAKLNCGWTYTSFPPDRHNAP